MGLEGFISEIILLLIGALFSIVAWSITRTLRLLREDINGLGKRIGDQEMKVARDYVTRTEHKETVQEMRLEHREEMRALHTDMNIIRDRISEGLGKVYEKIDGLQSAIFDMLDRKADKKE